MAWVCLPRKNLGSSLSVVGVDISPKQVTQAQRNVPGAEFASADMTKLDYPPAGFDGIAAFYSIIHVPRQEHAALLRKIAAWLRPGGIFVGSMGAGSIEAGYKEDWLGAPMFWSSFDARTNEGLVKEAGLRILSARQETADEFGKPVTFLWVVACKPKDACAGRRSGHRS